MYAAIPAGGVPGGIKSELIARSWLDERRRVTGGACAAEEGGVAP